MKQKKQELDPDDLLPEYEFDYSKGTRGKYYQRLLKEGANVVIIDPDVAKAFHDSASVNNALRLLLDFSRSTRQLTKRSLGTRRVSVKQ